MRNLFSKKRIEESVEELKLQNSNTLKHINFIQEKIFAPEDPQTIKIERRKVILEIFLGIAGFCMAAASIFLAVQANNLSKNALELSVNQAKDHSQIDTLTRLSNISGLQLSQLTKIAARNAVAVEKLNFLIKGNTNAMLELQRINLNTQNTTGNLIAAIEQLKTINENTLGTTSNLTAAIQELKLQNNGLQSVNDKILQQLAETHTQTVKIDSQLIIQGYQNTSRLIPEALSLSDTMQAFLVSIDKLPSEIKSKRDLLKYRSQLILLRNTLVKAVSNYFLITQSNLSEECGEAINLINDEVSAIDGTLYEQNSDDFDHPGKRKIKRKIDPKDLASFDSGDLLSELLAVHETIIEDLQDVVYLEIARVTSVKCPAPMNYKHFSY